MKMVMSSHMENIARDTVLNVNGNHGSNYFFTLFNFHHDHWYGIEGTDTICDNDLDRVITINLVSIISS